MTDELVKAFANGKPPFHGLTLVLSDLTPEDLLRCYRAAVGCLSARGERLRQCADWHWHDGFVTGSEPLEPHEWRGWTDSAESLMAAWRAEDYVHRGVYPESLSWYLRFHLWEDSADGGYGMDVSGEPSLVHCIRLAIEQVCDVEPKVEKSDEWFDSSGYTSWDVDPQGLWRPRDKG